MAQHQVTEEYFSGQGVVMAAFRDADGKALGFRPLGNVPALSIKNAATVLEHKESTTGQRGTDKRLTTEVKVNLELTMENFNSENIAFCTRGTATDVTGAAITGELTKAYAGAVTALAHIKVSTVVVKQSATTLIPYTIEGADWDYKLNADAGSLMFNTVGAADIGSIIYTLGIADISVDYTFATQTQVHAFTEGQPELFLRFEGLNTAEDNAPVVIEVFKFAVDPTQDLSLISDTLQSFVLQGSVLKDSSRTTGSPYYRVTKIDEA